MIEEMFDRLKIFSNEECHQALGAKRTEAKLEQHHNDDKWAVSLMLMHVSASLLIRVPVSPRVVTAHDLLQQLAQAAKPFRFMDLPLNIRQRVYGLLVPTNKQYEEWPGLRIKGLPLDIPDRPSRIDELCRVSQEFCREISRMHYSQNSFFVHLFLDGPEALAEWAKAAGISALQHLRDLEVRFTYDKRCWNVIHAKCNSSNKLETEAIDSIDYSHDRVDEDAVEHTSMIESLKEEEQWESTGVIEFFILDMRSLRRIFWGPPGLIDEEDIDERNAYEVAFGRCECDELW